MPEDWEVVDEEVAPVEEQRKLPALEEVSPWLQFRSSPAGRALFGPSEEEKAAMAGGVSGSQVSPVEIGQKMLEFTSLPPQVREPVRSVAERAAAIPGAPAFAARQALGAINPAFAEFARLIPEGLTRGIGRGMRETALTTPMAPLGAGLLNKAALAAFGAEYLKDLPDRYKQFKEALDANRPEEAAKIVTETVGGAAMLGLGGAHAFGGRAPEVAAPGAKPPIVMGGEPFVNVKAEVTPVELEAPPAEPAAPAATTERPTDAIRDEKAAEVYEPVPDTSGKGVPEVPAEARGGGVQEPERAPEERPQEGEVPLKGFDAVKQAAEKLFPGIEVKQTTPRIGIEISADGKTLNLSPTILEELAKEYPEPGRATEAFGKLVKEEITHHRHISRLGEGFNDKLSEIWESAPDNIKDLVQKVYGKQPGMEPHHWGAELLRMADQAKNTGDITETMHNWNADKAREAVGPLSEWAKSQTGKVSELLTPEQKPVEGEALMNAVSQMSAGDYFSKAEGWAKESMAQKGLGPARRAEEAARQFPDVEAWREAYMDAADEAQRIKDEIKANPKTMMARQKEMMGAGQKAQFFQEGLKVLEEGGKPQPVDVATESARIAGPPGIEATREPELGTQMGMGVDPAATYRAVKKIVKPWVTALTPAARNSMQWAASVGNQVVNAPHMTDLKRAALNWSAKLQRSFGEAAEVQNALFRNVPKKVRREGIINWIQAGGDRAILQQRLAQSDPKYRGGYAAALALTPEEIGEARKVKQTFDALAARAQKYGILQQFKDNYVTQVWDLKKGPVTGSTRTLRDKFRFAKASTFANYFEGEQAGYVPKVKDIAKVLPMYMHEMNNIIAARQFVQEMSKGKMPDGRPILAPRGHATTVSGPTGQAVLVMPTIPKGQDVSDYKILANQPALSKWTWVGKDTAGNPVFSKDDVAIHPDAYKYLRNVLGRSGLREWYQSKEGNLADIPKALVQGIDLANSETKRLMLGLLSPFHQVQEGWHGIGHRINPVRVKEGGFIDKISGKRIPEAFVMPTIDLTRPDQMDAAQHGLMLLPDRTSANQFMEGFRQSGIISKIPIIGPLADRYAEYLFHEYIPGMKFLTYQAMVRRNQGVYRKELAAGKITPSDVKLLSALQANAAYGHINYTEAGRNPTVQHFAQLAALAPDFLEARAKFTGQAITGAAGLKVGREQLIALGAIAIAQAVFAYTMSKLIDGKWGWKHPFEWLKGNRRYTMRSVPEDLYRLITDWRPFVYNRLAPLTGKGILQYATGVDWRGQKTTAWETTKELLQQPIPLTIKGYTGVGNSPLTGNEQLANAMGLKISRYDPGTDLYKMAQEFKRTSGNKKWVKEYERARKTTNPESDYQPLRQALEKGDERQARIEYAKLLETKKPELIDRSMRPFTIGRSATGAQEKHYKTFTRGSKEEEKAFIKSLGVDEKEFYKTVIKEHEKRWQEYKDFKARLQSRAPAPVKSQAPLPKGMEEFEVVP